MSLKPFLRRITTALTCVTAVCAIFTSCNKPEIYNVDGVIWGTTYHITAIGKCKRNPGDIATTVLDTVSRAVNMFDPTSELGRFNETGTLDATDVFLEILSESRYINTITNGTFDPTIGPLIEFWGFGPSDNATDSADLAKAREIQQAVGMDKIVVGGRHIARLHDLSRLDFGAIAKGYGVDRVTDALVEAGFNDVMVEIGGEVSARGVNQTGEIWRIQIDAPVRDAADRHIRLGILELNDASVATSGNYRNFRQLADGTVIAHTIDPISGAPVESDILSATIIAASCMRADALATASMVLGKEKAVNLIDSLVHCPSTEVFGAIFINSDNEIITVGLPSSHASFAM